MASRREQLEADAGATQDDVAMGGVGEDAANNDDERVPETQEPRPAKKYTLAVIQQHIGKSFDEHYRLTR